MGVIWHEAIIIEGMDLGEIRERIVAAAQAMPEIPEWKEDWPGLVSPVMKAITNYSEFLFIAPDGSKEGWDCSGRGDAFRQAVIDIVNAAGSCILAVRWGDYDPLVLYGHEIEE